ncbi:hypothetical protein ACI5KX_07610 [Erythrobacter sp. GH1-10]|uniref:hypothetical protein n=1 Tax=Erythrobacter sp. GH1-10 TaxID=3349334 RepID=UPI003877A33F
MIKRRLYAAIVLLAFAIGSVLFWNDGEFDLFAFGLNLIFASIGFVILHHRWKRQEAGRISPSRAKDIFS